MDFKRTQDMFLVWLDSDINKDDVYYQNIMIHLRRMTNSINTFTNGDDCILFLEQIRNEKVCIVVSSSLTKCIVPRVHDMCQVESIFILGDNRQFHENWAQNWSKISGVYTDVKLIHNAFKHSDKHREQNAICFSLVTTTTNVSEMNLDRLDPMFMYTQIIKEILLDIEFEHRHLLDFTQYCREMLPRESTYQLNKINTFEVDYRKRTAIWWYTSGFFLHSMLNQALRLSDIDVIVRMGFFISNLHRQIEQLHQQQFIDTNSKKIFTVYRGQRMSTDEFNRIANNKDGLISFNNFLSTSTDEDVSMSFIPYDHSDQDIVGVLFTMQIDPQQSTAVFASVAEIGAYQDQENEILFSMHTIFRIRDVKQMHENSRVFRIELELTSDNDEDLQILTKHIRKETLPHEQGWGRLAYALLILGKAKQAEDVYRIILQQETDESKNGRFYALLGRCKCNQGDYDEAIRFFEKSVCIFEKYSPDSEDLAKAYNNIGIVYKHMREYTKSLSYCEKALAIKQHLLSPNHSDFAATYNNIGVIYRNMHEYKKALLYHDKALEIWQQILPFNHPNLANTFLAYGLLYFEMNDYSKSIEFYEKALAIQQQSLPVNHPDLRITYTNLGHMYENMTDYLMAYSFYDKALKIVEQSLPSNHPALQTLQENIDRVKNK